MTTRADVMAALHKVIADALPDGDVTRNAAQSWRVEPGRLWVDIEDGEADQPQVLYVGSPRIYLHDQRCYVVARLMEPDDETRTEILTDAASRIGDAVARYRTLGGLVDDIAVSGLRSEHEQPDSGGDAVGQITLTLTLSFESVNPAG